LDLRVPEPEEMSRDELVALAWRQDGQITTLSTQVADLLEANGQIAALIAMTRNSPRRWPGWSTCSPAIPATPPCRRPRTDEPGKTPVAEKKRRGGPKRPKGKQPGAPGANLAWVERPDDRQDRFPQGHCECGHDLADATDLGVVDRHQQHEIPQVSVKITQYDQHRVRCGCGTLHTATRPDGARTGPVGYGPNLQAFAVYLMVVHFIPVQRCVELLESLTGATPSAGFVHGMLNRAAGLLAEVDKRIRTLITLAYAVCCDETPLRVGPREPKPGRKKADKYLLVACTELYTHYLLGDRDVATFKAFVLKDLTGSVVVHDRYHLYDSAQIGELTHQLCLRGLGRGQGGDCVDGLGGPPFLTLERTAPAHDLDGLDSVWEQ
jgi:transposase